jgi:cellulose synthase/poly-beta-1,6-N-acetylglucosamine synthase-like glycosyltransferase/MoaA/NifB/PqqE/SkfB family radical SAM enzyme
VAPSGYRLRDVTWLKRAFLPDGLPLQLTFFVTSRCNAKCSHCFYGDQLNQPLARELTVPQIDRIASGLPSRMLWVAFGGGEPFMRNDLPDVAEVFFRRNSPRLLTIVTNGIKPDRIERMTREILPRRRDTFLNIAVSLDALAETHDRERGVPGNFRQAIETLKRLRALRDSHPGLGFSTLTTVHRRNAHELSELEQFIEKEIRPDNRGLNLVRGTPFDPATLDVDLQPYREAVERKRRGVADGTIPLQSFALSRLNGAKERVLYDEVERTARTGTYKSPCRAGRVGAVLYEDGSVAACEILSDKMGNLRDVDFDFPRLWFGAKAEALRKTIDERRCRCTWECAVNTNVLFGPRYWPQLLREWVTGGRKPRPPQRRVPVPASVSIIVPCRDEEAVIRRKIRNSLGLRYPDRQKAEILVVDDGSTDSTVAIVESEIAQHQAGRNPLSLRLVRNSYDSGKAGALRAGIEQARGEIVLLTDADVVIEREGLARALAYFADPSTGVVCGEQVYCRSLSPEASAAPGDSSTVQGGALMDHPGRHESIYDRVMRGVRKVESRIDSTFAVHGQMMLFRRSLDLQPRAGVSADDVDLSLQARRKGYRIRYAEGARFWEERPTSLAADSRQKKRRGMSLAQVLWRNRDMLGRPRYGMFGLVGLPFEWVFLLAQPVGVALLLTLGVGALLAWSPLAGAVTVAVLATLAAASRAARTYLYMNATMLSGMVALVTGRSLTDRWARDRDAHHTAG